MIIVTLDTMLLLIQPTDTTGNAYQQGDDPAYTHDGYLYCDGSEYNIADYPALFEVIGNDYGGRSVVVLM